MPALLSDGRTGLWISTTAPEGYDDGDGVLDVSLADAALIDTKGQINKPDFRLSPTASDTVSDVALDEPGNGNALGASNYEGNVTVMRQYGDDHRIDPDTDTVFTAIGEKGVEAYYLVRQGPSAKAPLAADDEGWIYKAVSDEPAEPTDTAGYFKNPIPLRVRGRRRFKVTA